MSAVRVLMVDDQPIILAALKQMLAEEPDLELRGVSDPTQALGAALEFEPAVILQDLVMEGIDGLTLLKRYRAHPQLTDTPVVMLSAAEEPETKVEAFRLGANDYVVKLPSALELAARIRYHGRSYHNLRQREAAFRALLESRSALQQRQAEIEAQKSQLEIQARQLEAVNRELADSALSDTLTGLRNRRFLRVYLDKPLHSLAEPLDNGERRRALRERASFFLFDLDHFKQINDKYGHDAGDAVLVEVASRLRQTVREGDACMRWGGEEFLIVARGLDDAAAEVLAGRILQAVSKRPVMLPNGLALKVTASLGYASSPWHDDTKANRVEHQLAIALADAGTYLSKRDGRHRAYGVIAGPDLSFCERLPQMSISPELLRQEDQRGVRLVEIVGS